MFLKAIPRTGRHALPTKGLSRQCLRFARLETNTMTSSLELSHTSATRPLTVTQIPRAVAVYCGANTGTVPAFQRAATCQFKALPIRRRI
jgi:hypothetical protein